MPKPTWFASYTSSYYQIGNTCRFYGVPTSIGGTGHTCGMSEFKQGEKYPTVNLDSVHARLQQISAELLRDMQSKHIKLADLLIPVSSAMIAEFNDTYLGLVEEPCEERPMKGKHRARRAK